MEGSTDDPRWLPAEHGLVAYLRRAGHEVTGGGVSSNGSRLFDAHVDGVPVEFKIPEVGANSATMRNRANESRRRGGQARNLIFDLRASRITRSEALRGVARIRGAYSMSYDSVRIIGAGFDDVEVFG